jgi:hypothetical protein
MGPEDKYLELRPDNNTVGLVLHDDGQTIVIEFTVAKVPVDSITASRNDISCSALDKEFKEKMMALKAGEQGSHTFPVPIVFERIEGSNAWKVIRLSESS